MLGEVFLFLLLLKHFEAKAPIPVGETRGYEVAVSNAGVGAFTFTLMGRFWIENEVVDRAMKGLSPSAFKVLLAVVRHYNKHGQCYPSIRRISSLANLHHITVRKSVDEIKLQGYFEQVWVYERKKLRLVFSKTALKLFHLDKKLLEKTETKERMKEVLKERGGDNVKINQGMQSISTIMTERFSRVWGSTNDRKI